MELVLMAKAFKLNYSTPTNNNQRTSSNLRKKQIAQPCMNMGQDRHIQMVGVQNPSIQNVGNQNGLIVILGIANLNLNPNGNGNVVATRAEGNGNGNNGDIDKIEEISANCILMANLQQASTSGTQTDKALVYDVNESAEPITEPHAIQPNNSCVIFVESSVEHNGGIIEQHPVTVEETRAYFESLYNNLVIEVEKVNAVNCKLKETNADLTSELARYRGQEKSFEINKAKFDELETGYRKSVYQKQCLTKKINALHLSSAKQITAFNEESTNLNNQLSNENSTISLLQEEKKRMKSDFKTCEDEFLDKQIQYE
uniref:Uncharacterized protein n=1 Tax=Tanacetum cinerariifolium TaxID=118510 RepID=A0A6L2K3Y3_TANCI|nr:hypothetical protein [Tanacetum cinerariifolium]